MTGNFISSNTSSRQGSLTSLRKNILDSTASVYWIHDERDEDVFHQGYVGVSQDPIKRWKVHLRLDRVPKDSKLTIIFSGSRRECFDLERKLRPQKGIGWNNAVGGSHGFRVGFCHTDFTRQKLRSSWTDARKQVHRKFLITVHNPKLKGQRREKQSIAMIGKKNPMYGKTHDAKAREKISSAHLGKVPWNLSKCYCVGCREKVQPSRLEKHHNKCYKSFWRLT